MMTDFEEAMWNEMVKLYGHLPTMSLTIDTYWNDYFASCEMGKSSSGFEIIG